MTGPAAPAPAPGPLARLRAAALLLLPLLALPLLVGMLLGGRTAAFGAILGSFLAFLVSASAGWRTALVVMPVVVVVAAVAGATMLTSAWVAVLLLCGAGTGLAGRSGLAAPAALVGLAASIAPALSGTSEVLSMVAFTALGGANGVLLSRRLGLPQQRRAEPMSPLLSAAATLVVCLVAMAAGIIAIHWDAPHAYWLPMTVFLLAVPSANLLVHQRAAQRLAGTVLGVMATVLLSPLGLASGILVPLGVACLLLSLVYQTPLWLGASLSTAATALLLTADGSDPLIGWERLEAVAIGSGLMVGAVAIAALVARVWAPSNPERAIAAQFDPAGVR